jgi:regulator of cell morphogenesis and NO signaling
MDMIKSTQSVGEIVSILPRASEIFKQYRIDFCCGGNRPLIDVIKESNLDESEILNKLKEAFDEKRSIKESNKDFTKMSLEELTEYIENTHHVYLKRTLPELSELTIKIMRVHGAKHEVLFRVHKLFMTLKADLERHLFKEEEILFPSIRDYDISPSAEKYAKVKKVMKETEDEHEVAGDILKELRKITEDYNVPADGCSSYSRTFNMLEEIEEDLYQHIHLENNILFKYFETN